MAALGLYLSATAQDQKTIAAYTYDVNGNRVSAGVISVQGPYKTETVQSINGRAVPLESAEERVVWEGPGGRVVERTIRRYTPDGQPGLSERQRIEETKNSDGTVNIRTAIYDSDINGSMSLRERISSTSSRSGEVVRTETRVERPNVNGSADIAEMRVKVTTGDEKQSHTDVTVLRRDTNGSFSESERQIIQTQAQNGGSTTTITEYNTSTTGKLDLTGQTVSRLTRNPDGSEVQIVDVYGVVAPGRSIHDNRSGPQLREQQIIEKRVGQNNRVVESFSVRRADLNSGSLGPATKISETICTGSCLPPPPAKP
jgi:hypothetical protein